MVWPKGEFLYKPERFVGFPVSATSLPVYYGWGGDKGGEGIMGRGDDREKLKWRDKENLCTAQMKTLNFKIIEISWLQKSQRYSEGHFKKTECQNLYSCFKWYENTP